MIKIFQTDVFKSFLDGKSLEECYRAVGNVANVWLDVLYAKGEGMDAESVADLITESSNMSKDLSAYDGRKSLAVTTARRLAEFLGTAPEATSGLNCQFIVSRVYLVLHYHAHTLFITAPCYPSVP